MGTYNYNYKVADDTKQTYMSMSEEREDNVVTGSYSYVDPEGSLITVTYTAGAMGYTEERKVQPGFVQIRPVVRPIGGTSSQVSSSFSSTSSGPQPPSAGASLSGFTSGSSGSSLLGSTVFSSGTSGLSSTSSESSSVFPGSSSISSGLSSISSGTSSISPGSSGLYSLSTGSTTSATDSIIALVLAQIEQLVPQIVSSVTTKRSSSN